MIAKTLLIVLMLLALIAISLGFFVLAFTSWPNGWLTLSFLACDAIFSFFAYKFIRMITGI